MNLPIPIPNLKHLALQRVEIVVAQTVEAQFEAYTPAVVSSDFEALRLVFLLLFLWALGFSLALVKWRIARGRQ